jgi:hypothetical protein
MKILSISAVLLLVFTANAIKLQHEDSDVTNATATAVASPEELDVEESGDKGNTLKNGKTLDPGEYLSSGNGYFAVFQVDGDLVLYKSEDFVPENAVWTYNA